MRVVADAHDYPDIEELHRRALEIDAGISLSTIYRSVRLFRELGFSSGTRSCTGRRVTRRLSRSTTTI